MNLEARVNKLINEGYEFKLEKYISTGFEIFKKEYGLFIGFSIIAGLISMTTGIISNLIPILGHAVHVILGGIINLGYFYVARKIKLGEKPDFGDFFKPFNAFGNLAGVALLSGVLIVLGFVCLIIPGIYLAIAWTFALPIIYFYSGIGIWDSMEASRRIVTKKWWWFLLLVLCLFLINLIGAMCLLIGLLVTIPASHLIMYAAFDDIMKPDDEIDLNNEEEILLDELK